MDDLCELRRKAARCRRLAEAVNDPEVVAWLEEMAHDFERRSREIEPGGLSTE